MKLNKNKWINLLDYDVENKPKDEVLKQYGEFLIIIPLK